MFFQTESETASNSFSEILDKASIISSKKKQKEQVLVFFKIAFQNYWKKQVVCFQKEAERARISCSKRIRNSKHQLFKKKQKQQVLAFHKCWTRQVLVCFLKNQKEQVLAFQKEAETSIISY